MHYDDTHISQALFWKQLLVLFARSTGGLPQEMGHMP